ncbi:hypothetical protein HS088_TW21G00500 [Tripterygium wilfordii]|uniref:Uncharacterized protein n=1 Tax=Tripterygium wilfordii TaxID=458696 RepID=A0A7J7C2L1_TRIWF|nr:uncharacterized protein LOC119990238 [Tripterygium wilfordii]KAF5728353.1 hypothetical protein HS088_TW21G00500 [Tripterygium wilfordii]
MGGGAAMRSVAKAAGVGLMSNGLRGGPAVVPPAEQNVLNVARPVSVILSSQGNKGSVDVCSVQRPSWELDDWEFSGGEDLVTGTVVDPESMARVVFGGAPSINEAKEATNELKDALQKVYLSSPNATGCKDSVEVGRVFVPLFMNSGYVENESCIVSGTESVPKHAVRAFKMLTESPAVQSVVASLACDQNVWNAVLQNEALVDFLQAQKSGSGSQDQVSPMQFEELSDNALHDSDNGSQAGYTAVSDNAIHDFENASQAGNSGSGFENFVQNIKHKVVDMVNNVSDFFHNIFGSPSAENLSANADSKSSSIDKTLIGLAMMVIMVVLFKRA